MAVTIATWVVSSETPMAKFYACTDSEDNDILIVGRPYLVSLGVTNYGNAGNSFGPLEGEEDLFPLETTEEGIEEVTGWSVIQTVLEAEGVDFTAVQEDIDTHLASLAYEPEPTQEWTETGISSSLLASITED